jgi:hypothetical protein
VTHAHTQTREPFSPLQKSHTLKKARIKEGLFIGPRTDMPFARQQHLEIGFQSVFVSVSWHTSAALMGFIRETTNVQCTQSKGSLDLLWRAETSPGRHRINVSANTSLLRHLAATHYTWRMLAIRCGCIDQRWGALHNKRTKHAESLGLFDLATCNRINDFHSPARSAR